LTPPSPLVSVVCAVHNGGRYLRSSLESVLSQTGVDFEFIIVDDGSTDGSSEVLDAFAGADSRIRLLRHENRGLTRSLIRGCAEARGRYIARHDADDLSLPKRLSLQSEALEDDECLSLISCRTKVIGPEGELLFEARRGETRAEAMRLLLENGESPHHGSVMMRADMYRKSGGYRPEFRFAQDRDLWLRMAELGDLRYVGAALYAFRISDGSISAHRHKQQSALSAIAAGCRECRLESKSEYPLLAQAVRISAEPKSPTAGGTRQNYFIGKCLLDRRDRRAIPYLWKSVIESPRSVWGWLAFVAALLLCERVYDKRKSSLDSDFAVDSVWQLSDHRR